MNLVYDHSCTPLRVMIVNPLSESGAMLCVKALRGLMFGLYQMVNLTLLVYSNELERANKLKWELDGIAFPCNNGIIVTSDLPSLSDADVFIFTTDLPNLNSMDFNRIEDDVIFDTLYLLLKIANHLEMPPPPEKPAVEPLAKIKRNSKPEPKLSPIIVTDGLVAMDIIKTFSKNLPNDIFFCPTPIPEVSRSILADKVGVNCNELNDLYVYAANDDIFYVDVGSPLIKNEKFKQTLPCEWDAMAYKEYQGLELEPTQFNASWLKKEFMDKIASQCGVHPNGSIYKASVISRLVQAIWTTRSLDPLSKHQYNCGVISDGTLETHKEIPYILPVIFEGVSYKINDYLKDDFHLKQEIKRINKAVHAHHRKVQSNSKVGDNGLWL